MSNLYLWLNIGSFIIPFLFSFHPKLQFYKKWPSLFPAIAIMMLIFIPWDIVFAANGFWGFNDNYLLGLDIFGLPLEEWLFFICIPYACIFTHYALLTIFPRLGFSNKIVSIIYVSLISTLIISLWYTYDHWYTLISFSLTLLILAWVYNYRQDLLKSFFVTYLVILIPFFLVNGILTGTGIEDQVVWYNNAENLGFRILTIPIEDTIYNLGMLLSVLLFTELFEARRKSRSGS